MNSFGQYLDQRLAENVSKQGQISQYEKSLNTLMKVRDKLLRNGMDTTDINNQMAQVHDALGRRTSGTHQWHGDIVRIDQEPINNELMWRLMTRDGMAFHIPTDKAVGVVKIPANWHQYPNPKKAISKYVEYKEEIFGYNMINLITYTENRTVDIVPIRTRKDENQYFLIRRKSGMWATVGGHIDEGELNNPILAARRELSEETGAQPLVIRQLPSGWIREVVTDPNLTPSAEYNSWTLPFIAIVDPNFQMVPSEVETKGGSWFDVGEMPSGFHFNHHKQVLQKAFEFLPTLLKQFGKY